MDEQTLKSIVAQVTAQVLATMAQPAETVTQAVVSVAKTGQRRISQAVMTKVKAQRMRNGGPVPNGIECWKLIDDGIIDAEGNYIADAKAPTATKTTVENKFSASEISRMSRAEMSQHISRAGMIAALRQ